MGGQDGYVENALIEIEDRFFRFKKGKPRVALYEPMGQRPIKWGSAALGD